ncbi:uncharacterized protein A4U43_C02F20720 [Asparagus officinalis]|uniref:Serine aminopeptidase S33 domain-containing protein n=1 Tax=Asparagus officinalis TaxID=4686 RepID=A0A5P1FPQ2_ASPOF|nr:acyltransferase-like protein At1g54570, chloroplastic isoform X3 [Asparagus officinalis]XP_020254805.1 acyltransferase-like protein At1g54570, chloroplastic isoform X3 [Asparagus officinalis]XP_020254806.1 acyltransferase-like protein At1g54570, chloroplastic isoform X3 [Asparagus officinalis]XP_020254807.1 acyltransferase-like protein At1g54570, chloroplastic isoform X3 [Asparagus officinalis]XP_020254808.1 acyltransferase-like protein At1g54570, chloroplastic isoform X3 [Asparagus officina
MTSQPLKTLKKEMKTLNPRFPHFQQTMASLALPLPITYQSLRKSRNMKPIREMTRIKKPLIHSSQNKLEPLYDDGYMTPKGIKEYHDAVSELLRYDVGPARWFCPMDCGPPIEGAPLLLFLPGLDGMGMGLFMHHKALGRIFEVRCMHVPFSDRTPLEGLLMSIEDVLRIEHSTGQNRPIYLLGHSFGGCLALSIAARNPNIDLIVILTNPATSFDKSKLQPLFPVLNWEFGQNVVILLFLILYLDNQVKRVLETTSELNPLQSLDGLSKNVASPLTNLSNLLGKTSNDTISWKLKLLRSAASHANSRLHAIKSEVVVFASCLDGLLPSTGEGERLANLLFNCKVYYFENHGHHIIMENGFYLGSVIKSLGLYRRARLRDDIKDFLPTTVTDLHEADRMLTNVYLASSPAMFSTMEDGRIVRGLSGIPDDGPVLLVGNHMLLGLDMVPMVPEFLREKKVILRGMGHPLLFHDRRGSFKGHDFFDLVRLFGAVPVTHRNLYRLLSEKAYVLLYPGGSREALHRKGEEYKLFWPDRPEFVRMAAKLGAKIVPFASVGEDDIVQMILDSDDFMSISFIKEKIIEANHDIKLKKDEFGDRDQDLLIPFLWPKIPGRCYILFGRPISMSGKMEVLEDREKANEIYLHVKAEVESKISYLLKKREEDPYRSILQRALYQAAWGSSHQVPSFEP